MPKGLTLWTKAKYSRDVRSWRNVWQAGLFQLWRPICQVRLLGRLTQARRKGHASKNCPAGNDVTLSPE